MFTQTADGYMCFFLLASIFSTFSLFLPFLPSSLPGPPSSSFLSPPFPSSRHKQLDEEPVASDEIETSAYYVRDALDANFTFAPTPGMTESKMGGGEGSGSNSGDSDVDIGTG